MCSGAPNECVVRLPPCGRWSADPAPRGSRDRDATVTLDANELRPMITYGTNPGMGMPIDALIPAPADVRAELVRLRGMVMQLAGRNGLKIVAAGTHPFSCWTKQEITPLERYMGVQKDLAELAQQLVLAVGDGLADLLHRDELAQREPEEHDPDRDRGEGDDRARGGDAGQHVARAQRRRTRTWFCLRPSRRPVLVASEALRHKDGADIDALTGKQGNQSGNIGRCRRMGERCLGIVRLSSVLSIPALGALFAAADSVMAVVGEDRIFPNRNTQPGKSLGKLIAV